MGRQGPYGKKLTPAGAPLEMPQAKVVLATHGVAGRLLRFSETSRTGSTPPETSLHMSSVI